MTDVVTAPAVEQDGAAEASDSSVAPGAQWAPAPPRRRRRWPLVLWIGIPVVVVAAAGWFAGTSLIAPGVTVAGVPVGGLTPAAAADRIAEEIAGTGVEITLGGVAATVTGADLGAELDARAAADQAFAEHPLWRVADWFPDADDLAPTFDAAQGETYLADVFARVWTTPVDAAVAYDAAAQAYVVTPGVDGRGIALETVERAYLDRLHDAAAPEAIEADVADLAPKITTDAATTVAERLNTLLATAGFYVGEERTVPLDAATVSSWLTLTPDPAAGTIEIAADEDAIQAVVDTLPGAVDRAPVDGAVVVNEAGALLRTASEGVDGRALGSTSGVAAAFAAQLAEGEGAYALDVEVTAAQTTTVTRLLEVDLSEQHLYVKENGVVVDHWTISSGMAGWETDQGRFTVNYKVRMQDMGNPSVGYLQPDVEWVMYFSGDQAFHAVYWRPTTAVPQSHGCVGMPTWRAKWLYEWADIGTDVWVHE